MINALVDWLVQVIDSFGYLGVGLAIFLESFIAPIPSQIILPFSGFVASQGTMNIILVIIVAAFGAYLGTLPFYLVGLWGDDFVEKFLKKYGKYLFLTEEDLEKGYEAFEKHGYGIVFFGRFIPLVRSVISFPAGAARMKFWVFSVFTYAGSLIFVAIMCLAGYFMGESWHIVAVYTEEYERVAIALLLIVFLLYIWRGIRKMAKHKELVAEEEKTAAQNIVKQKKKTSKDE
jgi:membrane protein DedA with SNARE-associated domain